MKIFSSSRRNNRKGFTLTEMLVVVAIIVILAGISVPSIARVKSSMHQSELNAKAETIYSAVQNQLIKLMTAGRGDAFDYGAPGIVEVGEEEYAYTTSLLMKSPTDETSGVKAVMNSDTVDAELLSNSWVIEFYPDSAVVKAVYYSEDQIRINKSVYNTVVDYYITQDADLTLIKDGANENVGYYASKPTEGKVNSKKVDTLTATVNITNGETLTADISCSTTKVPVYKVQLWNQAGGTVVTSYYAPDTADSDYKTAIAAELGDEVAYIPMESNYTFTLTLDSLEEGKHFKDLYSALTPGESLSIAVTPMIPGDHTATDSITTAAVTNSLFADESNGDTAVILCARHLQNLNTATSGVTATITKAVQKSDINLTGKTFTPITNGSLTNYTALEKIGKSTVYYKITGLTVGSKDAPYAGDAGLFGVCSSAMTISGIKMTGTYINATGNAGALVGSVTGGNALTIQYCQDYLTKDDIKGKTNADIWISGANAGGLVGAASGTVEMKNSSASTVVRADASAGGLVGTASSTVKIQKSYADCYLTGVTAGGLVGTATGTNKITNAYAAGYMTYSDTGAGLVVGKATLSDVYTVMATLGTVGDTYYGTVTGGTVSTGKKAYYRIEGTVLDGTTQIENAEDISFEYTGTGNPPFTTKYAKKSYVYELTPQKNKQYTLPTINSSTVYHYGDWELADINKSHDLTLQVGVAEAGTTSAVKFTVKNGDASLDKDEYDSKRLKELTHTPQKDTEGGDYTLVGWYSATDGTGTKVLNADGTIAAEVSGYTKDKNGTLVFDLSDDATLYAYWSFYPPVAVTPEPDSTTDPGTDGISTDGAGDEPDTKDGVTAPDSVKYDDAGTSLWQRLFGKAEPAEETETEPATDGASTYYVLDGSTTIKNGDIIVLVKSNAVGSANALRVKNAGQTKEYSVTIKEGVYDGKSVKYIEDPENNLLWTAEVSGNTFLLKSNSVSKYLQKDTTLSGGSGNGAKWKIEGNKIKNIDTGTTYDFYLYKKVSGTVTPLVTYTVKYNANGGSGSMSNSTFTSLDNSLTLRENKFTKTGSYTVTFNNEGTKSTKTANITFGGWSKSKNNTAAFDDKQTVTASDLGLSNWTKEITLYACWSTESITLPDASKSGLEFMGWYNGDTRVGGAGDSYTPTGNVSLTARYGSKYVLTNELKAGSEYVIVNRNSAGNGYAASYGSSEYYAFPATHADVEKTSVTVQSKDAATFVVTDDPSLVWTAVEGKKGVLLQNNKSGAKAPYLFVTGTNLVSSSSDTFEWKYSSSNGLRRHDLDYNYVGYANNEFKIMFSGTPNVYIYEKLNGCEVTLDSNGGTPTTAQKVSVTMNSASLPTFTPPERTGYDFAGWYTSASGGTQVTDTSGKFKSNVSGYTDASGNWTRTQAVTLYAHWTINYTIHHYLLGTTTSVAPDETGTKSAGSVVTGAKSTSLYSTYAQAEVYGDDASRTITLSDTVNTVNVYYTMPVTVTADAKNKTYGEADPKLTATVSGTLGTDTVTYTVTREDGTDAGTYDIFVSGDELQGCYKVTYKNTSNGFTINKRPVTLTSGSDSKTYDGTALTKQTVTVTSGSFATGEGATYSDFASQTYVGSTDNTFDYTLNPGTNEDNYDITVEYGTLAVTQKATVITVTANSANKVYDGTALTNSGFTCTNGVLVSGDTLSAVISGTITNVGTAENTVTDYSVTNADGDDVTDCYTITTKNGTLAVTPKAVTVTAISTGKTYGEDDPTLTATVEGTVGTDTVTYNVNRQSGENVGEYTITPSGNKAQGNYTVSYVPGTFTITTRPITVEGKDKTVLYNGNTQTFIYSETDTDMVSYSANALGSGLVSGQTIDIEYTLEGKDVSSTGYEGTLTTTIWSGTENVTANYSITSKPGKLIIKENTFALILDANNGTGDKINGTVNFGGTPTYPDGYIAPEKTGYTLKGYTADGRLVVDAQGKLVASVEGYTDANGKWNRESDTKTVTLYAKWEKKTYNMTYYANNGTTDCETVKANYWDTLTVKTDCPFSYEGHNFLGWSTSPDAEAPDAAADYRMVESMSLYAVWKAHTYTVSYDANGGTGAPDSQTKTYGKTLTLSTATPTRDSYTFLGWAENPKADAEVYKAGGDYTKNGGATLYAVWKYTPGLVYTFYNGAYTLTMDADGGTFGTGTDTTLDITAAYYGGIYTDNYKVPTREGYTLSGWLNDAGAKVLAVDGDKVFLIKNVDGYTNENGYWMHEDATLKAQWKPSTFTVKLHPVGADEAHLENLVATAEYEGNTLIYTDDVTYTDFLKNVEKTGYSLDGWYTAETDGDKILNAADASVVDADVDGYIKKGGKWACSTQGATIDLYSHWTVNKTTLNLVATPGSGDDYTLEYGATELKDYKARSKAGYTLDGWYTDDGKKVLDADGNFVISTETTAYINAEGKWISCAAASDTVTLEAHWTGKPYTLKLTDKLLNQYGFTATVTYGSADVTNIENLLYGTNKLEQHQYATPSFPGYTFYGWYTQLDGKNNGTGTKVIGTDTTTRGDKEYPVLLSQVEGYTTITGEWANDKDNIELFAQWQPNTYEVRLVDGSSTYRTATATYNSTVLDYGTNYAVPKKDGYTFGGWYSGDTQMIVPDNTLGRLKSVYNVLGDSTYYAKWTADTYPVNYNANAGTDTVTNMPDNTTKTHDVDLTISSAIPTRNGYDFMGWAANNASATAKDYDAGGSYTANEAVTLYAVWQLKTYTITYKPNAGGDTVSNMPSNTTKTHDVDLTISSAIPTRDGYDFLGWDESSSATTATYRKGETNTYTTDANLTLYAVWQAKAKLTLQSGGLTGGDKSKRTWEYANVNGASTLDGKSYTREDGTTTGTGYTKPAHFPKNDYTLEGWYTKNDGTGTKVLNADGSIAANVTGYTSGGKFALSESKTLYALWSYGTDEYILTNTLVSGKEYIFVDDNTPGADWARVLESELKGATNETSEQKRDVIPISKNSANKPYVESDSENSNVWIANKGSDGFTLQNKKTGKYLIVNSSGKLTTGETATTKWSHDATNNRLSYASGKYLMYEFYDSNTKSRFAAGTDASKATIYLYARDYASTFEDGWAKLVLEDNVLSGGSSLWGAANYIYYNRTAAVAPTLPSETGYTFDGWYAGKNRTSAKYGDSTGVISADTIKGISADNSNTITLYACWKQTVDGLYKTVTSFTKDKEYLIMTGGKYAISATASGSNGLVGTSITLSEKTVNSNTYYQPSGTLTKLLWKAGSTGKSTTLSNGTTYLRGYKSGDNRYLKASNTASTWTLSSKKLGVTDGYIAFGSSKFTLTKNSSNGVTLYLYEKTDLTYTVYTFGNGITFNGLAEDGLSIDGIAETPILTLMDGESEILTVAAENGCSAVEGYVMPTHEGKTLKGWFTEPEGGVMVLNPDGSVVTDVPGYSDEYGLALTGDLTLYAQWEETEPEDEPEETPEPTETPEEWVDEPEEAAPTPKPTPEPTPEFVPVDEDDVPDVRE